jgi:hypothetical protein
MDPCEYIDRHIARNESVYRGLFIAYALISAAISGIGALSIYAYSYTSREYLIMFSVGVCGLIMCTAILIIYLLVHYFDRPIPIRPLVSI